MTGFVGRSSSHGTRTSEWRVEWKSPKIWNFGPSVVPLCLLWRNRPFAKKQRIREYAAWRFADKRQTEDQIPTHSHSMLKSLYVYAEHSPPIGACLAPWLYVSTPPSLTRARS